MKQRIKNVNPTKYNSIKFRSKLEADTAKIFDSIGISFQYEPYSIELQESFRYRNVLYRKIEYKPDFIIGNNIIIECKGFETPEWKIKRKLLLHRLMIDGSRYFFYEMHNQKDLFKILDKHKETFNIKVECSNGKIYNSLEESLIDLGLENKITSVIGCIIGRINSVSGYTFKYSTGYDYDLVHNDTPFKKLI